MASHADRQPAAQIKIPGFRLVWRALSAPKAKWYGSVVGYAFIGTPRRLIFHLSGRGLLLWGTGATLSAYLLGAAALAWYWGRNPYNHISYADLVLPTHWAQLRELRGQGQIDEGIHELRVGHYGTGIMFLNSGIARKPADFRGRLALAQVNISMGYLYRGAQLLEDGLDYGAPPRAYVDALCRLMVYLEDYERVLSVADRIEAKLPPDEFALRRRLLAQRAVALEKLQRYDELERLRSANQNAPSFALESAWARAQAERGRPQDALLAIARDPGRFGVTADRCQLQIGLAVAAGDARAAEDAVRDWLQEEPTRPQPRIEETLALIRLGDGNKARERLQRFFIIFSGDRSAVVLLFKKLSELPDVSWLQLARREAEEYRAWTLDVRILYVQGLIQAGKIPEAFTEFRLTADAISKARVPDGGWAEGTQGLLDVITSDTPSNRSQFLAFFRIKRLTPEAFRFALKSLQKAGSTDLAAELALVARNRFPALREAAPTLTSDVTQFPLGPKTAPALQTEAQARVELRRLDADLQAGRASAAFERLKKIEAGDFPALRPELLMRDVEVRGALDEPGQVTAALQFYLASPNVNQAWLRELAAKWQALGRQDSVAILARETIARFPDAKWAGALLPGAPADAGTPSAVVFRVVRNETEGRQELRLIDEDLAAGRPTGALQRVKGLERAKIDSLQSELMLRRISIHGALREQIELSAALGAYLSGNKPNLTALRALALQWDNASDRDSALSLLRETLARFPQALWALELRKKIEGDLVIAPDRKLLETGKP
jgi:hypothetical protein